MSPLRLIVAIGALLGPGAEWTNEGDLVVGNFGTLNVQNGGHVSSFYGLVSGGEVFGNGAGLFARNWARFFNYVEGKGASP